MAAINHYACSFGDIDSLSTASQWTPPQVAAKYGFPAGDGEGICIGVTEFGGGFEQAKLNAYFAGLGVLSPTVVWKDIGLPNRPGSLSGPSMEVYLDLCVIGAIAPKAKIVVYGAPPTAAGFEAAFAAAVADMVDSPALVSNSWGGPEDSWTLAQMRAIDAVFQRGITKGMVFFSAAGDSGSSDGEPGRHVDFPASSPHCVACGGTYLPHTGAETVWDDSPTSSATGGGVSTVFAAPLFQSGLVAVHRSGVRVPLAMRGIPDVAGNADPNSGYLVVDGQVVGGTSAVAPLWAALFARIMQATGRRPANVLQTLYAAKAAFNDIVSGNDGAWIATPGWDACTGLGSPKGDAVLAAFGG